MDEGRKRVLLIAASILAATKLANWDRRRSPALEAAISDAISLAERIMWKIDGRSAIPPDQTMTSNANIPGRAGLDGF